MTRCRSAVTLPPDWLIEHECQGFAPHSISSFRILVIDFAMIQRLPTAIALFLIIGLAGCNGSTEPGASTYSYVFEESNDTPHALAATLFHAVTTDDESLWKKYTVTFDELKAYRQNGNRSTLLDENIRKDIERAQRKFVDVRDELRFEKGVHGAERIRFLRSRAQFYSPQDSTQEETAVEYSYQDHYLGAILFRRMIKTDRGWVFVGRTLRNANDVTDLIPLGMSRR